MKNADRVIQILVVEDDPDDIVFLELAFQQIAFAVEFKHIYDPDNLSTSLDTVNADFVFLDIVLGRKDGVSFLREIRQNATHRKLPVIIYTSLDHPEQINRCHSHGANYYIIKPISVQELSAKVKRVMEFDWKSSSTTPPLSNFVIY